MVFLQMLGIGMALAVLVEATLIRAILLPALMRLAGPANWWAPGPLRRLHTRLADWRITETPGHQAPVAEETPRPTSPSNSVESAVSPTPAPR